MSRNVATTRSSTSARSAASARVATSAVERLDQSYELANTVFSLGHPSTPSTYDSQGITPVVSGRLTKISTQLKIGAGTLSGNISCYLYTNNAGEPGTLLATFSTIDSATLGAGFAWYDFTLAFANAPRIIAGTVYQLVWHFPGGDDANYAHVNHQYDLAGYAGGYMNVALNGTSWTPLTARDINFKQYYSVRRQAVV